MHGPPLRLAAPSQQTAGLPDEAMEAARGVETANPVVRRSEDESTGLEPMESESSSGSPSTTKRRRRSSLTFWKDAVSFSSCTCVLSSTRTLGDACILTLLETKAASHTGRQC